MKTLTFTIPDACHIVEDHELIDINDVYHWMDAQNVWHSMIIKEISHPIVFCRAYKATQGHENAYVTRKGY